MPDDVSAGTVCALKPNGSTVGTGFVLTSNGLIATCAHVVRTAGAGPGDTMRVVLYATGEERQARVDPEWWRTSGVEDVDGMWGCGNLGDPTAVAGEQVLQLTGTTKVTLGFNRKAEGITLLSG